MCEEGKNNWKFCVKWSEREGHKGYKKPSDRSTDDRIFIVRCIIRWSNKLLVCPHVSVHCCSTSPHSQDLDWRHTRSVLKTDVLTDTNDCLKRRWNYRPEEAEAEAVWFSNGEEEEEEERAQRLVAFVVKGWHTSWLFCTVSLTLQGLLYWMNSCSLFLYILTYKIKNIFYQIVLA